MRMYYHGWSLHRVEDRRPRCLYFRSPTILQYDELRSKLPCCPKKHAGNFPVIVFASKNNSSNLHDKGLFQAFLHISPPPSSCFFTSSVIGVDDMIGSTDILRWYSMVPIPDRYIGKINLCEVHSLPRHYVTCMHFLLIIIHKRHQSYVRFGNVSFYLIPSSHSLLHAFYTFSSEGVGGTGNDPLFAIRQ